MATITKKDLIDRISERTKLKRVIVPIGGGGTAAGLAGELCPEGIEVLGVSPMLNCSTT